MLPAMRAPATALLLACCAVPLGAAAAPAPRLPLFDRAIELLDEQADPRGIVAPRLVREALEGLASGEPRVTVTESGEGAKAKLVILVGEESFPIEHLRCRTVRDAAAALGRAFEELARRGVEPAAHEPALVAGLLHGHDPHSELLAPDEATRVRQGRDAGALGVVLAQHDGRPTVRDVLPGSPAAKAGLLPGDVLVAIDGETTAGLDAAAAGAMLLGPPGSAVALELRREGGLLQRSLVRIALRRPSLEAKLDGRIGILRLREFGGRAAVDVAAALDSLQAEAPLEGLVLDLRGNPGGLVEQAVQLSDLFLDAGLVVETVGARTREVRMAQQGVKYAGPLVVLVDDETASAAEIAAGALRLQGRAALVGGRTFGKGSVQLLFDAPVGWAVKLTVAHYRLAGGYTIRGRGLEPDAALQPIRVGAGHTWGFAPADLGEEKLWDRASGVVETRATPFLDAGREGSQGDPAVAVALTALRAGPSGLPELQRALTAAASAVRAAESARLSTALGGAELSWASTEPATGQPLALALLPGTPAELRVRVTNRGSRAIGRVRLWSRAAYPALDRFERLVGLLAPGASVELTLPLALPETPPARATVRLVAEGDEGPLGQLDASVLLRR